MSENPYTTAAEYEQAVNAVLRTDDPERRIELAQRIADTHTANPELATDNGNWAIHAGIATKLRQAARDYYDSDNSPLTDAEYDDLLEQVRIFATENPQHADKFDDLLNQVAAGQSAGGDVEHSTPMGSLDKVVGLDKVTEFVNKVPGPVVVEPKLDGLAINARYEYGRLVQVATRGDGIHGEDITDAVKNLLIKGLPLLATPPLTVNGKPASFEVRGEVFVADKDFALANDVRQSLGGNPFVNSRNAAAGILRKGDPAYAGVLTYGAYSAMFVSLSTVSWSHDTLMDAIERSGITTARSLLADRVNNPTTDPQQILDDIAYIGDNRANLGFPIDGCVIKAATVEGRIALGEGNRAPRWAVAYKYQAETAETRVVAIHETVGKTGRLALRVEVEPVFVGGTTITYLTGHNVGWMLDKDIRVGDRVQVRRAGDVIPYIDHVILSERPADSEPWTPPETDPAGNPWDKSTLLWRSTSPELSVVGAVVYGVSRDVLDVDGCGEEIVTALVENGYVNDIADLFNVGLMTLTTLPLSGGRQLGSANARKIDAEIQRAKGAAWNRVITALSIRMTGRTMGRRLAAAFPTMDRLRSATVAELAAVDGIGEHKATVIRAGLDDLIARGVLDRLAAAGVNMGAEPTEAAGDLPLAGMTVVVSGSVPGLTRTEIAEVIEQNGGKASSSVSKTTSLLVSEPSTSSKYVKAQQLGIKIVEPTEFLKMIGR